MKGHRIEENCLLKFVRRYSDAAGFCSALLEVTRGFHEQVQVKILIKISYSVLSVIGV